jgi:hypothetical protein
VNPWPVLRAIWHPATPLSSSARAVLQALLVHSDGHRLCWPGERLLAAETGTSERTVRRARLELREQGLIEWDLVKTPTGVVARYRLDLQALLALAEAAGPVEKLWKSGPKPVENPVESCNDAQEGCGHSGRRGAATMAGERTQENEPIQEEDDYDDEDSYPWCSCSGGSDPVGHEGPAPGAAAAGPARPLAAGWAGAGRGAGLRAAAPVAARHRRSGLPGRGRARRRGVGHRPGRSARRAAPSGGRPPP